MTGSNNHINESVRTIGIRFKKIVACANRLVEKFKQATRIKMKRVAGLCIAANNAERSHKSGSK
jgi:hypothetical protein